MHSALPPRALLLALALAVVATPPAAQPAPAGFEPRTGDAWVDTWLDDVNRYAGAYRDPFIDELVRYHRAPRDLVLALLARPGWTAGDVYFACALAAQVGRPCRYVADEYDRDRAGGWGALAQRLGIVPGSIGFHRLKSGFGPTYQRWGRPIRLDAPASDASPAAAPVPAANTPAAGRPAAGPPGRVRSESNGPEPAKARQGTEPTAAPRPPKGGGKERGPKVDGRDRDRD